MKAAVLGSGAYGIALSIILNKNNEVKIWTKFESEREEIIKNGENTKVLKGVKIPKEITISTDFESTVIDADIIVIAVPAAFVNDISQLIKKYYKKNQHIIIASKGIERDSCLFVADILKKHVKTKKYGVISGPSFAVDIVTNSPIGLSVASPNKKTRKLVKDIFKNTNIKIRDTKDVIGLEICGSIKNVIAIAAGILDGLGYPESTQAMFITESLHDIKELIYKLGGNKKTILSYAGFGDLLLTATSKKSRNFTFGYLIGSGKSKEEIDEYLKNTTVEGYYTIKSIYKLLRNKKVKIPIINLIYRILENGVSPDNLSVFLMNKD